MSVRRAVEMYGARACGFLLRLLASQAKTYSAQPRTTVVPYAATAGPVAVLDN